MPVPETTKGLIGEYICASALLELGWKVSMAQQDSVDLLAWKDDQYLRVQVKSASLRLEKAELQLFIISIMVVAETKRLKV